MYILIMLYNTHMHFYDIVYNEFKKEGLVEKTANQEVSVGGKYTLIRHRFCVHYLPTHARQKTVFATFLHSFGCFRKQNQTANRKHPPPRSSTQSKLCTSTAVVFRSDRRQTFPALFATVLLEVNCSIRVYCLPTIAKHSRFRSHSRRSCALRFPQSHLHAPALDSHTRVHNNKNVPFVERSWYFVYM